MPKWKTIWQVMHILSIALLSEDCTQSQISLSNYTQCTGK